jgi:hypothetical protein
MEALTHEQIREKLREMRVDTGKCLPFKHFSFMVKNPNYDPDNFSQEIEDSEEEIDTMAEIWKESSKPDFDWVWNNTIGNIPKNSERWLDNHDKKCRFKLLGNVFLSSCSTHIITTTLSSGESSEAMVRDYDNDFTMNKILEVEKEYGEIYEVI